MSRSRKTVRAIISLALDAGILYLLLIRWKVQEGPILWALLLILVFFLLGNAAQAIIDRLVLGEWPKWMLRLFQKWCRRADKDVARSAEPSTRA